MTAHTQPIKCGHCNENNVMKLIGDINHVIEVWESEEPYPSSLEFYYTYQLLECPKCKNTTIAGYGWRSDIEDDVEFWESLRYSDFLYPPNSMYSVDVLQKDPAPWFIDPTRIKELSSVKSAEFDLSRLVKLCNEINNCYANSNLFAVVALARSVIDHVPPVFQCTNFNEVANNYAGTKSFKKSVTILNNSLRNIADAYLHTTIRKSETLPNKTQVNFFNDMDVLLAEIVRLLKK